MDESFTLEEALEVCTRCAQMMLENGGETYRAEEVVLHIASGLHIPEAQAMALPTGVFIMLGIEGQSRTTVVRRVASRSINLGRINEANTISRALAQGEMTVQQALSALRSPALCKKRPFWIPPLAAAVSAGFFTLLFGGNLLDFFMAFLNGMLAQFLVQSLRSIASTGFMLSLLSSMVTALAAVISAQFLPVTLDAVIAGGLMPLLPGLAMTNAIRDTMRGDLVSGVARAADALLTAAALAAGVGFVMGGLSLLKETWPI